MGETSRSQEPAHMEVIFRLHHPLLPLLPELSGPTLLHQAEVEPEFEGPEAFQGLFLRKHRNIFLLQNLPDHVTLWAHCYLLQDPTAGGPETSAPLAHTESTSGQGAVVTLLAPPDASPHHFDSSESSASASSQHPSLTHSQNNHVPICMHHTSTLQTRRPATSVHPFYRGANKPREVGEIVQGHTALQLRRPEAH